MSTYTAPPPINSWAARMGPSSARLTDEEFWEFCQLNRHLRVERTSQGEVIIMPPSGAGSSNRGFKFAGVFYQ